MFNKILDAQYRRPSGLLGYYVDLRLGDAACLPFEDATFDKAFSIHSVYFWPQPLAVLERVHRVLKPGGMFVLTVLPKEKWNAANSGAQVGTPECTPYSGDELARMMGAAGFSQMRISADADEQHPSNYSIIGVK